MSVDSECGRLVGVDRGTFYLPESTGENELRIFLWEGSCFCFFIFVFVFVLPGVWSNSLV